MATISISNRVYSALVALRKEFGTAEYRFFGACQLISAAGDRIQDFEFQFDFLSLFLGGIKKWSDAVEVVPDLGAFSVKIEDAIHYMGNQLWSQIEQVPKPKPKSLSSVFKRKDKLEAREMKSFEEWVSKVVEVILNSMAVIENLKQEIEGFCESFSSHSIQCRSPVKNIYKWRDFLISVEFNSSICRRGDFCKKLGVAGTFCGHIARHFSEHPDIGGYVMHVAGVALRGAILACECWVGKRDFKTLEDMDLTLSDLKMEIDFTNPYFVDMNLRLLRALGAVDNYPFPTVDFFIEYLFSYQFKSKSMPEFLEDIFADLHSVIVDFLIKWKNNSEDALGTLDDVKILIMEIESRPAIPRCVHKGYRRYEPASAYHGSVPQLPNCEYHEDFPAKEHGIFLWDLHAKLSLIKIENFLRNEIRYRNGSLLSVEELSDVGMLGELNLEDEMRFLNFVCLAPQKEKTEILRRILTLLRDVANAVEYLKHTSKGMTTKMVRNILFEYLVKVMLLKGESSLIKLLNNKDKFVLFKDQMECLKGRFRILKMVMKNEPVDGTEDKIQILARIEALTREIFICYSFSFNKMTEEMTNIMKILLDDLLEKANLILVGLKEIYLPVPRSSFSKRIGLGFMDSLLRDLKLFVSNRADLITFVKLHNEGVLWDLNFLNSFLKDILEKEVQDQELKELGVCAVEMVQETEYFIDYNALGNGAGWRISLWIYNLSEDIRLLKARIGKANEKKTHDDQVRNLPQISGNKESEGSNPNVEETMVGLNDHQEIIIGRLNGGPLQQRIVPIVGMPGIGKTTLAKKVYNHPLIVHQFHVRAWCYVSQTFRKRELLLRILSHITVLTDEMLRMVDEDLGFKLYQQLKSKRYLIVLDDMWNCKAWDELKEAFPNDGNGSRILLTSRHRDVPLRAQHDSDPHVLPLLSDDESWELLQKKAFHTEVCPEELGRIGKKIAKNCKGLPLAIVTMAGLLQRTEKQLRRWNEIAERLSSRVLDDPEMQCKNILELSYRHLPDYLKSCFLYFGAFLEDEDIPVQKLIQLWIAEGFIPRHESKSLEDLAENYLKDLIFRNLVMVSQQRSKGGVKSCRIHDLLRCLCLEKAKEEKFLRQVMVSDKTSGLDYGVEFNYSSPSSCVTYEDQRLSICSKRKDFVMSRPFGACVRSVLFFASSDMYPRCPYDLSFIADNFKLLKVLNLQCINMGGSFPKGLGLLIHLRYLAICGDIDSVPSSISNLSRLETLIVKGLKGTVQLPDTIWDMERLRHIHVTTHAVFNIKGGKNSSQLEDLVSLSSPILSVGENTKSVLRQFPNLRKLRCIFLASLDSYQNCNFFPGLDILIQLESLKTSPYGSALHPVDFCFPMNLRKLTLSNFQLPWSHISSIGRLQNLEVLKLLSRSFDGELWDMVEEEFCRLKFLKLEALNIIQWNASCDHLPKLEHLVLRHCKDLEEIPSSFLEIPTLQKIEVQWCGEATEDSARRIQDEAYEGLNVFINLVESETRASSIWSSL